MAQVMMTGIMRRARTCIRRAGRFTRKSRAVRNTVCATQEALEYVYSCVAQYVCIAYKQSSVTAVSVTTLQCVHCCTSQPCMKHTRALLQMGHRRCVGRGFDCMTISHPRQTAWCKRGLRACPQAHRPGGERDSSSGVGRSEEKSSKQSGQDTSGNSGGSKPSAIASVATRSPHALRRCAS